MVNELFSIFKKNKKLLTKCGTKLSQAECCSAINWKPCIFMNDYNNSSNFLR